MTFKSTRAVLAAMLATSAAFAAACGSTDHTSSSDSGMSGRALAV